MPLLHSIPVPQLAPHAPQLASSDVTSKQPVLHTVWPATGHTQLEALHTVQLGQALSQRPQCAELMRVSMHAPAELQYVCPDTGHWQLEALHTVPLPHALSHAPQWAAFAVTSTHAPAEAQ